MTWPSSPPLWLEKWMIWYLKGKPGPRPSGTPMPMTAVGWQYLDWYIWRAEGGLPTKRPHDVPLTIPQWAWNEYKIIHTAVAPPPAPPAPSMPAFKLPVMFTAWGFGNGTWTPDVLAEKCKTAHIGTVALQISVAPESVTSAFTSRGIDICAWGIAQTTDQDWLNRYGSNWYMPQVEDFNQYTSADQAFSNGIGKNGLKSIVTTLGMNATEVADLANLGVESAFVECYGSDGYPHADIDRMLWQAHSDGWKYAVPVVGLYGGYHLNNYDLSAVDKNFGVWIAEETADSDWDLIRKKVEAS